MYILKTSQQVTEHYYLLLRVKILNSLFNCLILSFLMFYCLSIDFYAITYNYMNSFS